MLPEPAAELLAGADAAGDAGLDEVSEEPVAALGVNVGLAALLAPGQTDPDPPTGSAGHAEPDASGAFAAAA